MTAGIVLSLVFGFIPMFILAGILYALDPYEKEPKALLGGVFAWGAVVAAVGALGLEVVAGESVMMITGSKVARYVLTASLFAPVIEEILKAMAVMLVFFFVHQEFDSILDGIVYAGITALGFAASEDVLYYIAGFEKGGLATLSVTVFFRFVIFGWQHVFFTAFTGIGLAIARLDRRILVKVIAPLAGLGLAILAHSIHNTILTVIGGLGGVGVAAVVAWTGWLVMVGFIVYQIYREKSWLTEYLRDEVVLSTITAEQYTVACSFRRQSVARINAISRARYRVTDRFFQLCGELTHKKRQLEKLGDESGNTRLVSALREEIKGLSGLLST